MNNNLQNTDTPLTKGTLWLMTITTGMVAANIYYNQPLLGDITKDFNVTEGHGGTIAMLTQIGYAAGMFFTIPLGDLLQRKRLIMVEFFLSIVGLLVIGFAPTIQVLMIGSFLVGAFSIIPQLFVPMAAQLSAPENRGKTIGFVMSGLLIGILLSRTISGYVGAHLGWRAMYWLAAGLMAVLAACSYFMLPEVYPTYKGTYKSLMRSLVSLVKEEPQLRLVSLRGALCFATFAGFWTTLVFLLQEPPFNAGSEVAGAFGLVGAFGAIAASQMGRLTDKWDGRYLSAGSILLIIVSYVVFRTSSASMVGLVIGVILLDMGVQATHISNQALILALRPEARNRLNTVYMVTYFLGGAAGTFFASQAWKYYKWDGVTAMGLILATMALLIQLNFIRRYKPRPPLMADYSK